MHRNPSRPLSPHLGVYKWGPHMLVSILHRMTGAGLALVGGAALVWWLVAAASGPKAYEWFAWTVGSKWALIIWIPLTWGLFQHTFSGIRHFVLDIGAGFELGVNRKGSIATLLASTVLTVLLWVYILGVR
jgi:succinate dehydrogenase / fumarate reductase cytochrome b subunit